eukprot:548109-Alexandrium_andersonii.AAC.1
MGLLRRSPWMPPGQGALPVQHFPAARAVWRHCTCGGLAARARVRCPVGPFQWPHLPPPTWPARCTLGHTG